MTDLNRSLAIRWFEEVWNVRGEAIIDQMLGPEAVGHLEGIDVVGPAEFKKVRAQLLEAFPDLSVAVEATAVDGDNVVVRWNARGTHLGSGFGIEATGTPVAFRGMTYTSTERPEPTHCSLGRSMIAFLYTLPKSMAACS
jgi:predicted ester cyclase